MEVALPMFRHPRLLVFAALVLAVGVSLAHAQNPEIQAQVAKMLGQIERQPLSSATAGNPIVLPKDPALRKKLEAARDYIQTREWPEAVGLLQSLLDARTDSFVEIPAAREGERSVWRSTREEAERLLAKLPAEGLQYYRLAQDPPAQRMLKEAVKEGDIRKLAVIVRRFRFTPTGATALNLLAGYHLDRSRPDLATLCYQRLLEEPGVTKLSTLTLFQACLAFHADGDRDRLELVWQKLEDRVNKDGMRFHGRVLKADEVRREIERWQPTWGVVGDSPLYRGSPDRTQAGAGDVPLLEPLWQTATTTTETARSWLAQAARQVAPGALALPAGSPITTNGKLIFRTHAGVQAVNSQTGHTLWHTPMSLSLESILANPARKVQLDRWFGMYGNARSLLYQNSSQGTLSSDGRLVFAIDDLPLPPHPTHILEMQAGKKHAFSTLRDAIYHNRLVALDADTGRVAWEAGGRGPGTPFELTDAWFLGPPLPLGNCLYAMIEKKQDLNLVCLGGEHGELLWSLNLASARTSLLIDVNRRLHGVHLAYRDGILVCSTQVGAVVAVNVLSRSLIWAQDYPVLRNELNGDGSELFTPAGFEESLKGCAPLIADGKVVVASPDADTLRCLQLGTGAQLWTVDLGEEDLYASVHRDKVLVVGRNRCRVLSLARGDTVWERNTPVPAGLGALALGAGGGSVYYLPLQSGDVLALNLDRPTESTLLSGRSNAKLGNLIFQDGRLWSQTATSVTAFPPSQPRLARVEERLKASPREPRLLLERARLRLDRGELTLAVADLRLARGMASAEGVDLARQLRQQHFDALTLLLQRDFAAGEAHLDDYRALCTVPMSPGATLEQRGEARKEEQRRHRQSLVLLAVGRESQGRFSEALASYRELHDQAAEGGELMSFPDVVGVKQRADLWAQNRVEALFRRTEGEAYRRLREQCDRDWRNASTTRALETCLSLLDRVSSKGWPELAAARLTLVERWGETIAHRPGNTRQAGPALLNLEAAEEKGETAEFRGRALLARARLLANLGYPEDAAECYRKLRRQYAHTTLSEGRTGADVFDDVSTDKRLLAYLEPPRPIWQGRAYRVADASGNWSQRPLLCADTLSGDMDGGLRTVQPERRFAPSLRRLQFRVDTNPVRLVAASRETGADRWSMPLPINLHPWELNSVVEHCEIGHLLVISVGANLVGVDLIERRVRWTRGLPSDPLPPSLAASGENPGAPGSFYLGLIGPMGRSGVYVRTASGLLALDLLTGQPRWQRSEMPSQLSAIGDENHLFVLKNAGQEPGAELTRVRSARAVRVRDGLLTAIPPAAQALKNRKRILGRCVLASWKGPKEEVIVQFYDLLTGKDLWRKSFPVKSVVMDSTIPEFLAVVQPDGLVALVDLQAAREGSATDLPREVRVDPRHVQDLRGGTLLGDPGQLYLALMGPEDHSGGLIDAAAPFLQSMSELTSVPVDGMLYAFDRTTGVRRWFVPAPAQAILLNRFEELPFVLCTATTQRQKDPMSQAEQIVTTFSIDKRTGKFWLRREAPFDNKAYHTLLVDPRTGTIDLLSIGQRLRHTLEPRKQ
jgi:outer membrane protein assembly factor BamB